MLFFTLSGFLMAYLYTLGNPSLGYWGAFLLRRFFRIYPIFIAVMLFGLACHEFGDLQIFKDYSWNNVGMQLLLLKRLYKPSWTIMFEVKFYILFFLTACAFIPFRQYVRYLPLMFVLLWITLLTVLFSSSYSHEAASLWSHLSYFMGGIILAFIYKKYDSCSPAKAYCWDAVAITCLLIIVVAISPHQFKTIEFIHHSWKYGWFFSPLMMFTLASILYSSKVKVLFSLIPLRFLGQISYSLYLIHYFIFQFISENVELSSPIKLFLAVSILLSVAWLLYRLIERPCNGLGKALSNRILSQR